MVVRAALDGGGRGKCVCVEGGGLCLACHRRRLVAMPSLNTKSIQPQDKKYAAGILIDVIDDADIEVRLTRGHPSVSRGAPALARTSSQRD